MNPGWCSGIRDCYIFIFLMFLGRCTEFCWGGFYSQKLECVTPRLGSAASSYCLCLLKGDQLARKGGSYPREQVFFLTWPWKLKFEEGKVTKQKSTAKALMKGAIWKQTYRATPKAWHKIQEVLGRGKEVMTCFHSEKEKTQFTTGSVKVRRDMLDWKDSMVQEISHDLCRQIPHHQGKPDPQPKEILVWLGNWGRKMNWGFTIFSCSA